MQRRDFLKAGLVTAALTGCSGDPAAALIAAETEAWSLVPEILTHIVPPQFPNVDFSVADYGAVGDNTTDCHGAFATAIEACSNGGGGRVLVPAGNYVCNGPIRLLSNVNLHLLDNAKITFGINPLDYLPVVLVRWQGIQCYNYSPLIYANGQTNIAVTGSGTFDGQAALFWGTWLNLQGPDANALVEMDAENLPIAKRVFGEGHYLRPPLFGPFRCDNILVDGVTFQGSPFWTIHPVFCNNVTISHVTVLPGTSNDDGCDPESCNYVLVDGCKFSTADDNVAVKSGLGNDGRSGPPSQNIVIQNCAALNTLTSGFCIGSGISGGIKNLFVQDCVSTNAIAAYYVKSNSDRGGVIESIYMRRNTATNCHHLIFLSTDYAGIVDHPYPPLFTDFYFEDMTADVSTIAGITFIGDIRRPIKDILLQDITIAKTPIPVQITNAIGVRGKNVVINGQEVRV